MARAKRNISPTTDPPVKTVIMSATGTTDISLLPAHTAFFQACWVGGPRPEENIITDFTEYVADHLCELMYAFTKHGIIFLGLPLDDTSVKSILTDFGWEHEPTGTWLRSFTLSREEIGRAQKVTSLTPSWILLRGSEFHVLPDDVMLPSGDTVLPTVEDSMSSSPDDVSMPSSSLENSDVEGISQDHSTPLPHADMAPKDFSASRHRRQRRLRFLPVDLAAVAVPAPEVTVNTVIFRPSEGDLSKSHQGKLFKEISTISIPVEIRDIRGGAIAVDFPELTNMGPILNIKTLQGLNVTATLPDSSRLKVGVIHNIHPDVSKDEFLAEASSDFPIKNFQRLAKPGCISWVAKITFESCTIPKNIRYAGRIYRISPFSPRPIQCRKCFKFGHTVNICRSRLSCPTCGADHDISSCKSETPTCSNCGGPHAATDVSCQARVFEAKVSKTITTYNISRPAAKTAVLKAARTYAAAASSKPAAQRPEPSRNNIFSNAPPQCGNQTLTKKETDAILASTNIMDITGLRRILELILQALRNIPLPQGTLATLCSAAGTAQVPEALN